VVLPDRHSLGETEATQPAFPAILAAVRDQTLGGVPRQGADTDCSASMAVARNEGDGQWLQDGLVHDCTPVLKWKDRGSATDPALSVPVRSKVGRASLSDNVDARHAAGCDTSRAGCWL
jgi:hypothetical protein